MTDRQIETKRPDVSGKRGSPSRRAYKRPELVAYGPLAKLTRGTRSGGGESTPQGRKKKL